MQTPHKIPEEKIWEFRECFDWFDRDGDQRLLGAELPVALRAAGQYWTLAEMTQLAIEFPASRPVTFPEFLSICSRKYGILPDPLAIERAFNVFDRNSNGRVVLEDVLHTMTTVGDKLTIRQYFTVKRFSGYNRTFTDQ